MRDLDVRRALWATELARHAHEPNSLVLDELGLNHGTVRIDVAVVNGSLTGYEIKSERDTLERLPQQAAVYSRIFDRMTLVCAKRHMGKAKRIVPGWWGLSAAEMSDDGQVVVVSIREGRDNPNPDPLAIASLLWREEALAELELAGAAEGYRAKPRRALYRRLVETLTAEELAERVRHRLKTRPQTVWRADALRT